MVNCESEEFDNVIPSNSRTVLNWCFGRRGFSEIIADIRRTRPLLPEKVQTCVAKPANQKRYQARFWCTRAIFTTGSSGAYRDLISWGTHLPYFCPLLHILCESALSCVERTASGTPAASTNSPQQDGHPPVSHISDHSQQPPLSLRLWSSPSSPATSHPTPLHSLLRQATWMWR